MNINQQKLLSYQQLLALHNLSRFDFPTKESIIKYLIRKYQEAKGHIFISE